MKMKLNRITTSLVSALFVFALISCELQAPSSVRIKSNPGLYVSLGSPFAAANGMSLDSYLSVEGLKDQFNAPGEDTNNPDIDILEWEDPDPNNSNVQAYRVRYPVADININLSEYVKQMDVASNLSNTDVSNGWIPGTGSEFDIPLPLDSMSFARDVTNVVISVTLNFHESLPTDPPDANATEDPAPAGVKVTFKGDVFNDTVYHEKYPEKDETKTPITWNSRQIPEFQPKTDKVSIGVTVPAGTWFQPKLAFEWEQATISLDAGEGQDTEQTGKYKLDFTNFGNLMGEGVSFKEISGYVYLKKPSSDVLTAKAELSLKWEEGTANEKKAEFTPIEEGITNWKAGFTRPVGNDKLLDLTDLFKKSLTFSYTLALTEVTIKSAESPEGQISVDMVILLPLEFKLDDSLKSTNFASKGNYKKLDLEMLSVGEEGKDLFGRDPNSSENDMFESLKEVTILISKYENNIIQGLSFGIKLPTTEPQILDEDALKGGTEIPITILESDINPSFNPTFELLVPDSETLKILKVDKSKGEKPTIDLSIAVKAQTDLDYQVKF
ncbi:MAG: hypothetical protein LBK00_04360 [Treponema sp.]|jgi:hypothetical protein|nr:hypothetical protein [Treponema sp.]